MLECSGGNPLERLGVLVVVLYFPPSDPGSRHRQIERVQLLTLQRRQTGFILEQKHRACFAITGVLFCCLWTKRVLVRTNRVAPPPERKLGSAGLQTGLARLTGRPHIDRRSRALLSPVSCVSIFLETDEHL